MEEQIFDRSWAIWMANTVLTKFPLLRKSWSYDYGVICKGMELVYELTGERKYYEYIKENIDYFIEHDGAIKMYDISKYSLDNINNGKIVLYLYNKTKEKKYALAAQTLMKQLENHPRTTEGGFWHKKRYPHQMWLDGLYMAEPFYAQYISMFLEKKYDDVLLQFQLIDVHLKDKKTHLLYHGWDENRKSFWADPLTGTSKNFWGRAMGWYACALVDTVDHIKTIPERKKLIKMIQDLTDAIIAVQSKEKGVWYQVLDKEEKKGNYPEASCSCMFVYFLIKAIRKGYIDRSRYKDAERAYYGIVREFIEVDENGLLNLKQTVYVSGLGGNRFRDGSYEYYISEPKQINNLLGIGFFLMASVEKEIYLKKEKV